MTKREKIILAVTGVVAVLGLGSLLLDSGKGRPGPAAPPAAGPAQPEVRRPEAMLRAVRDASLGKADATLLAAVEKPWRKSALYDRPLEGRGQSGKPAALPRYTGYVELGSARLAVVDGLEYQAGDALEGGGYKVMSVAPDLVVLENMGDGQRVEIPYQGLDAQAR